MKFVVACDSFKGCMTSQEAVQRISKGIQNANPNHEVAAFPMCDGGEGTMEILCQIEKAQIIEVQTVDAYGKPITASYGILPEKKKAIMEVASCIGLSMTEKKRRNPMIANSRGIGKMIKDAVKKGCTTIVIGLGGTATNDGGMGLLQELGLRFYDKENKSLICGAYSLGKIDHIDTSRFMDLDHVRILAAADVRNPLLGPKGATFTFGRQKGLFPSQLTMVDHWMRRYRDVIQKTFGIDLDAIPGGGAAGGIGAVLVGILHAQIQSGITMCMEGYQLENVIQKADIVITGEGQTDLQTRYGKVPFGVAQLAKKYHKPVLCLSGALGLGYQELYQDGFDGLYSSADRAMDFMTALKNGPEKLENLAFSITKTIDAIARMEDDQ